MSEKVPRFGCPGGSAARQAAPDKAASSRRTPHVRPGGGAQRRRGQALLELTAALVVILVLAAGLLQIGRLSMVQLQTMCEARGEAAACEMNERFVSDLPGPAFIADWTKGKDNSYYSADDEVVDGNPATVKQGIIPYAKPDRLRALVPGNRISNLAVTDPTAQQFDIVKGHAESKAVELFPVVQHLLYQKESIKLKEDAFMVWTKGIY